MGVESLTFVDNSAPACDAAWLNSVENEINNVITNSGQTASVANANQLGIAAAIYASGADFYTDSGSSTAYVLTAVGSKKAPIAYFNGMKFRTIIGNTNTSTTPTINVAGIGVINIKSRTGTAIAIGDLVTNTEVSFTYDGTNARINTGGPTVVTGNAGALQALTPTVNNFVALSATTVIQQTPAQARTSLALDYTTILGMVYPIGSYYLNETDSTNPGTLFGFGTWTAVTDKFIVAHGSTYTATGGAATVTLAANNVPTITSSFDWGLGAPSNTGTNTYPGASNTGVTATRQSPATTATGAVTSTNTGGGSPSAFSIIPPYQAAYIWKRTA